MKLTKTWLGAIAGLALTPIAFGADPYKAPDDSWITLSGKVKSVSGDSFKLDYGGKEVRVEMDDFDRAKETALIKKGDQVMVTGLIDDDLFERAKVEASTVYVKSLDTHFLASANDEEDPAIAIYTVAKPITIVQGEVTGINGREFSIDTGQRRVTVDTSAMQKNPMQAQGNQKVEKGDRVSVAGTIDRDLFETRELMASSIVTISEGKKDAKGVGGSGSEE